MLIKQTWDYFVNICLPLRSLKGEETPAKRKTVYYKYDHYGNGWHGKVEVLPNPRNVSHIPLGQKEIMVT